MCKWRHKLQKVKKEPWSPFEMKLDLNISFVRGWVTGSVTWPSGFSLTEDMVKES